MIAGLWEGMYIRLPSGNSVVLLRQDGATWACEYLPGARERGEVEFLAEYLRKHGKEFTLC